MNYAIVPSLHGSGKPLLHTLSCHEVSDAAARGDAIMRLFDCEICPEDARDIVRHCCLIHQEPPR